ncbi:MAG TPA: hypothetical protein VGD80_41990 [Kofleriaceae bacterium]
MTLAADLLDQAGHLAAREPGRPKQASLRRAISAAYYSLFHLVVDDATRYLVGGASVRSAIARSFDHQAMRAAAEALGAVARKPTATHWFRPHLHDPIAQDLMVVCDTIVELQEQRHKADYDTGLTFTRLQSNGAVSLAIRAHAVWPRERNTQNARAFMLAAAKLIRSR